MYKHKKHGKVSKGEDSQLLTQVALALKENSVIKWDKRCSLPPSLRKNIFLDVKKNTMKTLCFL